MIHFLLCFNRQGKTRLSRWYSYFTQKEKTRFIKEIVHQVMRRREKDCNFIIWRNYTLVYKRYASLYFLTAIDNNDNELITLELIHRYVVILDKVFQNICEMDLIFEFEKAYCLLDEYILGGEQQESSLAEVVESLTGGEKYEKAQLINQAIAERISHSKPINTLPNILFDHNVDITNDEVLSFLNSVRQWSNIQHCTKEFITLQDYLQNDAFIMSSKSLSNSMVTIKSFLMDKNVETNYIFHVIKEISTFVGDTPVNPSSFFWLASNPITVNQQTTRTTQVTNTIELNFDISLSSESGGGSIGFSDSISVSNSVTSEIDDWGIDETTEPITSDTEWVYHQQYPYDVSELDPNNFNSWWKYAYTSKGDVIESADLSMNSLQLHTSSGWFSSDDIGSNIMNIKHQRCHNAAFICEPGYINSHHIIIDSYNSFEDNFQWDGKYYP